MTEKKIEKQVYNWPKDIDTNKLPKTKGMNVKGYRFYAINNENFPSVTTFTGFLTGDVGEAFRKSVIESQNQGEQFGLGYAKCISDTSLQVGKAFHSAVERYLRNEPITTKSVMTLGLLRLARPYLHLIQNVRLVESIMYSKKLILAGQVDCVAEYNNKLSVIDFKTASKLKDEEEIHHYFLQTSCYAIMYEELFGKKIEQIVVIIAGKNGEIEVFTKKPEDYYAEIEKKLGDFFTHVNKVLES